MPIIKQCEQCGYKFKMNLPAVDTSEAPYFQHTRPLFNGDPPEQVGTTTDYICSTVCMDRYLEQCEFTEPRGPNPPDY